MFIKLKYVLLSQHPNIKYNNYKTELSGQRCCSFSLTCGIAPKPAYQQGCRSRELGMTVPLRKTTFEMTVLRYKT